MTTRVILTLTCALLLPACPGDDSSTTAETTGGSTTADTTGTTGDTTAKPDDSTTGEPSNTTGMPDPTGGPTTGGPTTTDPTTGGSDETTGTTGPATEPMIEVCATFCAKDKECCADEFICEPDPACLARCEEDIKVGDYVSDACGVLKAGVYECSAGLDCRAFLDPNDEDECSKKEDAASADPACALPPPPPICTESCAKLAACDLPVPGCEEECTRDYITGEVHDDPQCKPDLAAMHACLQESTCSELKNEDVCPYPETCSL